MVTKILLETLLPQLLWETARNFTVSGDATTDSAQSFDGSGNVALPITLANSGVSAGSYGSGSAVPVLNC